MFTVVAEEAIRRKFYLACWPHVKLSLCTPPYRHKGQKIHRLSVIHSPIFYTAWSYSSTPLTRLQDVQNDHLNVTFTDTLLLEKVTIIGSSCGDTVGVEVAAAAGDKVTTGVSKGEPVKQSNG